MREFKLLLLSITILLGILGCSSSEQTSIKSKNICPACNMSIAESKLYSTSLHVGNSVHDFDDIGCMVLYSKENKIDLKQAVSEVFATDTKKYITSSSAYYRVDETTPMGYGFAAYEKHEENNIKFDEVITKMLRGEHMANPKIKKQILGSRDAD